jgi:hypothetical protein
MACLDRLPESISAILIAEWNGPIELARLDSACCNKQIRPLLINVCQQSTFGFCIAKPVPSEVLVWMFTKNIRPRGLLAFRGPEFWSCSPLSEKILEEKEFLFTEVVGLKMSMGYRCCDSEELDNEHSFIFKLIRFLNMCPKLKEFSAYLLHTFSYLDLFCLMDQSILRQMTSFSLLGMYDVDMAAVQHLSATCVRLVTLEMNFVNWNETIIFELLSRHSTSLTSVSFSGCKQLTDALLEKLIECLSPCLKSLTLCALARSGSAMTTKYTCGLFSSCKVLVDLYIHHKRSSNWWTNCVKVRNKNNNSMLFLSELTDGCHEILFCCPNNHRILLSNLRLMDTLLLAALLHYNPNLHTISINECILGPESFDLLRNIFYQCTSLVVIKITSCCMVFLAHNIVSLLSNLPLHVTSLLIGMHITIDLADLQAIVKSNLHLEVLWFANCMVETLVCDYEATKLKVLACGGPRLRIVDDLWPEFADEFFDFEVSL